MFHFLCIFVPLILLFCMRHPGTGGRCCMYEKVSTVTMPIEGAVSLGQGERGPDRDSYFPKGRCCVSV